MNRRRLLLALLVVGFPVFALAVNPGWMTNLEAAKARAAKEKKPLLIEFTGSTWCGPCKALSAQVLSSPQFAAATKEVVLVALDFPPLSERTPEKIRANPELARLMSLKQEYGVTGFPTMLAYDAEGKELARIVGYGGENPADYIKKFKLTK